MLDFDANDPVMHYLRELETFPPVTPAEEVDLFRRARLEDPIVSEQAKRRLIEANLHSVVAIARRHESSGLRFLDLIQEGNLGLMRAVEKFPVDSTIPFTAYASAWIERAILAAISQSQSRTTND
jgi:RNA polymerase primary sigma factor